MTQSPLRIARTVLCAVGICSPGTLLAADFHFHPSIALSEEYNDNIRDTAQERKTDFVTRVQPGASFLYRAARASADASYAFDYRNYARGGREDEKVHSLVLSGTAVLVENFFFLQVDDTLRRTSLDVARDVTTESLFARQSDENHASVSPYLLWRLGEKGSLKTGYRYSDVRYWGGSGGNSTIDRTEHRGYAQLEHHPASRLTLTASYSYGRNDTDLVRYNQQDASGGFRYEYADRSFLFGDIGNSWQDFADGGEASNFMWHAGLTHDFGQVEGTLDAGVQYLDDPLAVSTRVTRYGITVQRRLEKGRLGVSGAYSEYKATRSTAQESPDRHQLSVSGFGQVEISPRLTVVFAATGDKIYDDPAEEFPYHFNGSATVTYGFPYEIDASLTYNYVEYRHEFGSAAGARQTNRVILEVRKVF